MGEEVKKMFAAISEDYDTMNNMFTFGMHNSWKKKLVTLSGAEQGHNVLDCASGTGDLAILFKKMVGENGTVLATDFCEDMLKYAALKAEKQGLAIKTELADAMNLPYEDNCFDVTSISYGIRNVDNTAQALSDMARVTKKGGCVAILETGKPAKLVRPFYNFFARFVIPFLGKLIAQNKGAYTYLSETAQEYPYGAAFLDIMQETGKFDDCKAYPMFWGVSYIYIGKVK